MKRNVDGAWSAAQRAAGNRVSLRADVAIVGAGPAGSTTALLLARHGFDVLLLDRRVFPRPKPCGDCLSAQATRVLSDLGLLPALLELRPARLDGWRITSPSGHTFGARFCDITHDPLASTALAVSRERMDSVLLDAARAAGARFVGGARVTDLADHGLLADIHGEPAAVLARLVVGADGLRSVVARRIGAIARPPRLRKVSLTAHVKGIPVDRSYGEMHVADGVCAGIAPVTSSDDVACNLTVVADAARFGRDIAHDAHAFFRSALDRLPALRDRCAAGVVDASTREARLELLASGPFDAPTRRITCEGVALVGDAAGYYDPFTGQGIHEALSSAMLLVEEAVPLLHGTRARVPGLVRYERKLRARVRGKRSVQRMIEAVLSRPVLADVAIHRLARARPTSNALLAVTGDLAPARSILSPAVMLAFAGLSFPG
jgi:menaquinone-9 beta-reductase